MYFIFNIDLNLHKIHNLLVKESVLEVSFSFFAESN